jgi:septum site-determining protein MinC
MEQERSPVRLKGMGDSLCVTLDPQQSADYLQNELGRLFEPLKHVAANARVTFDVGGQAGCEDLIENLGKFLKETFGVGSVSALRKKRLITEEMLRQRDVEHSWNQYRSDVLMLAGRVRSGQKVTAEKHLLILGDVNPGAEVAAGGDIIIMGSLCGIAAAGQPDNHEVIVIALDFRPTQVQIGGFVAAGLPPSSEKTAEFAYVENGNIVVEHYLKANPFGKMPWPQVR